MKSNIYALTLFLVSLTTHAGESRGFITNVFMHTPGVVLFGSGNILGTPVCNVSKQWGISMQDPMGKSMLAIILAAQAEGKQVVVKGYTNTCRDWPDRELPSYIVVID
jgi:hypothetical protein